MSLHPSTNKDTDTDTDPAALPTLGSTLLKFTQARTQTQKQTQHLSQTPLPAAVPIIDDTSTRVAVTANAASTTLLPYGFQHGEVSALAGAGGTGKTLVALHALASFLLSGSGFRPPTPPQRGQGLGQGQGEERDQRAVAFVDTTGSFSPARLRDVLLFRLRARTQRQGGWRGSHGGRGEEEDGIVVEEGEEGEEEEERIVMGLLDRVKVMRVFDLAGLVEAMGEVGEMRERERSAREENIGLTEQGPPKRRLKVEDSEEEEEEEEGKEEDQEMLDDEPLRDGEAKESAKVEGEGVEDKDCVGMIIIDTVTNVASSAVSKSPVQGQALLASFMQSLQHLTARYQICTILINSAVGLNPSMNPEYRRHRADDNVSAFASSPGKPALGKAFANWVDTSIFLTTLPKTREDAITAYGDVTEGRIWQKAIVLEVLKDRHGSREGQWAAFEIEGLVNLVPYSP